MARVSLRDVNKIYRSRHDEVHAVSDLNLTINDGEFVAILGPSGCGKTSTLRMIVGLEEITSGEIYFDDVLVNKLDSQARNVAMAFETYALYPNFTVEENLAFPLEVRGLPQPERRKRAREIAELLRIDDILNQKPTALSGGQQQRVSLGRALIRDPAVFILDEVMSHIDAHLKFQMLFDLKSIHQELKKTMVYVTHDQVEALALADRVAVMSNAELQQVGSRNDLYHTPSNVFVADFIGEPPTNFFDAELFTGDNGTVLRVPDSDIVFQLDQGHAQRIARWNERELKVGIRPQSLHLGGDSARPALEAEVAINEYLGELSILTLASGGRSFRALVDADTAAQRGDRLRMHYALDDVMVFSAKTELIIL
ncbi:ABC transporter ATP-binding protein [Pelagibius sp.]|uniref:ABC transporter ATP-binding protein n=1 Tax=Pelagibius sp. TaxID=1931238 RepID=UPI0026180B75|nr:ABC transporter ATP-binding protein [Pelagibius sp.]